MAEQGLKLPDLNNASSGTSNTETGISAPQLPPFGSGREINAKEMVIAIGAIIVAAIIFFIIKNYVSKMLVASYRKSPRSADMAAWSLFCILLLAAVGAAMGILDSTRFLALPYLIPIGLAMLASLIMFIVALISKH